MFKQTILLSTLLLITLFTMALPLKEKTYAVSIEFSSIGTGVPSDEPLIDFIAKFKKDHKLKKITAEHIGPLGREGEYKLAFCLKEMNAKQRSLFIQGLKATVLKMNDRGHANVTEKDVVSIEGSRATAVKQIF